MRRTSAHRGIMPVSYTHLDVYKRQVLDWAISARTPSNEFWIAAFTNLGRTVPMVVLGVALTCAIYLRWRRRTAWVLMLVAAAGSICFTLVGKPAFARTRPPLGDAVPPYEDSFSFPSGHTLNSTVVAGMLAYLVVWLSTVCLLYTSRCV